MKNYGGSLVKKTIPLLLIATICLLAACSDEGIEERISEETSGVTVIAPSDSEFRQTDPSEEMLAISVNNDGGDGVTVSDDVESKSIEESGSFTVAPSESFEVPLMADDDSGHADISIDGIEGETYEVAYSSSYDVEVNSVPIEGYDPADPAYFMEIPEYTENTLYMDPSDRYEEFLEDPVLIEDAKYYVDSGYYVSAAEQVADKGVFLTLDESHFLYRGFIAMSFGEESCVVYEFIVPEYVFDILNADYQAYECSESDNGITKTYDYGGFLELSYDREDEIMLYKAYPDK